MRMGINLRSHLAQQQPTSNNLWLTRDPRRLDYILRELFMDEYVRVKQNLAFMSSSNVG